jgi:uncharacterized protein YecT (DUF1311 family)
MMKGILAVGLVLFATAAYAEEESCTGSTAKMRECGNALYEKDDQELNRVYQEVKKGLDAEGQGKLITSEQAWIKYRDANCAFHADEGRGGSIQPLLYLSCLSGMTKMRTAELQEGLPSQ